MFDPISLALQNPTEKLRKCISNAGKEKHGEIFLGGKHLNTGHGSIKEAIYKVSDCNTFDTSLTAITSSLQI